MKKMLCASLLCLASLSANAAVFNAGVINPQQQVGTNNFTISESPFNDVYNFTLLGDAIFTSNVTGLGMALLDTDLFLGPTNLNLVNTVTTPMTAINIASGPVTLSAGNYSFMIAGLLSGESGAYVGSYTIGNPAQAAAVPEPESYAMFLAGLGLLGFVSRKRKTNS